MMILEENQSAISRQHSTMLDIFVAPAQRLFSLVANPDWKTASAVTSVLLIFATLLSQPAMDTLHRLIQQNILGRLSGTDLEQARAAFNAVSPWHFVLPSLASLLGNWLAWAALALIFRALGAAPKKAWAAAANAAVIAATAQLMNAILIVIHGTSGITTRMDLNAIPSPAMLVSGDYFLGTFLFALNPLNIWFFVVVAMAVNIVSRKSKGVAVAVAGTIGVTYAFAAAIAVQMVPMMFL